MSDAIARTVIVFSMGVLTTIEWIDGRVGWAPLGVTLIAGFVGTRCKCDAPVQSE
jgi:hypothetical protein